MDRARMEAEFMEMRSLRSRYPAFQTFHLYRNQDAPADRWDSYFWEGQAPSGHTITAKYSSHHPNEMMRVFIKPDLNTHHKLGDNSLCYMKSTEWSANWTAAAAILTAFRFIDDFQNRRVC